ncbi:hypothetical protein FRC12_007323 [Ceratobasidium sp. 428]|nr:hypothetical protein FRC12_007323 [Ceratobasidium sp. 428]
MARLVGQLSRRQGWGTHVWPGPPNRECDSPNPKGGSAFQGCTWEAEPQAYSREGDAAAPGPRRGPGSPATGAGGQGPSVSVGGRIWRQQDASERSAPLHRVGSGQHWHRGRRSPEGGFGAWVDLRVEHSVIWPEDGLESGTSAVGLCSCRGGMIDISAVRRWSPPGRNANTLGVGQWAMVPSGWNNKEQ